jgi:DNA-binding transcriptional regulator LsrR (DeoR family)
MAVSPKLLAKVCQYYYRDQLTMAQIGGRLGVSRHKVGRLIKEAVETGVVRFEIRTPFSQETALEHWLEAALKLKTSVVVEVEDDLPEHTVKARTCAAGAAFLGELIGNGDTIGIGWGSTTFELVNQLASRSVPDATVVQVTGGNKWLSAEFDCQEVSRRLAAKLGVAPVLLHAPGIVDNKETRELLLKESAILDSFRHFDSIDIAVVGIGALVPVESSTLLASGYVPRRDLETLKRAGAVGDVFSYFVDADGKLVRNELYDHPDRRRHRRGQGKGRARRRSRRLRQHPDHRLRLGQGADRGGRGRDPPQVAPRRDGRGGGRCGISSLCVGGDGKRKPRAVTTQIEETPREGGKRWLRSENTAASPLTRPGTRRRSGSARRMRPASAGAISSRPRPPPGSPPGSPGSRRSRCALKRPGRSSSACWRTGPATSPCSGRPSTTAPSSPSRRSTKG